jgi:uncharacterized protein CbrC (UPF0167 family)
MPWKPEIKSETDVDQFASEFTDDAAVLTVENSEDVPREANERRNGFTAVNEGGCRRRSKLTSSISAFPFLSW